MLSPNIKQDFLTTSVNSLLLLLLHTLNNRRRDRRTVQFMALRTDFRHDDRPSYGLSLKREREREMERERDGERYSQGLNSDSDWN